MKDKTCKACKEKFTLSRSMQSVCSPACALALVTAKSARQAKVKAVAEKRETKARLEKLKSRAEWAREAQAAFNRWVRLRDAADACISCGRHHQGQYHAGHYLSRGAHPELAYEPLNCHKQCSPCNTHLSGNIALYRGRLIEKIGAEAVAWLEGPHEPKHYTIDDLRELKARYTRMARDLEKRNG